LWKSIKKGCVWEGSLLFIWWVIWFWNWFPKRRLFYNFCEKQVSCGFWQKVNYKPLNLNFVHIDLWQLISIWHWPH
jgi:hypothetical protein